MAHHNSMDGTPTSIDKVKSQKIELPCQKVPIEHTDGHEHTRNDADSVGNNTSGKALVGNTRQEKPIKNEQ